MPSCDSSMTTDLNTNIPATDLKTARENSGLTLKELFERTRVSVINLEAIENGDFHLLPVPLYARNFIKTYANALGVDSAPILQRYENYIQTLQAKEKNLAEESRPSPLSETLNRNKAVLWIGCIFIVFMVISFVVSISYKTSMDLSQNSETQRQTAAVQPPTPGTVNSENLTAAGDQPKPDTAGTLIQTSAPDKQAAHQTADAQNTGIKTAAATPKKNDAKTEAPINAGIEEPLPLVIYASEETWIRIQEDDKEPVQVLLKPGEKISYKAARFNMDVGNAGGIRIQLNGKNIENLGKSGQVIHLRLP